MSTSIARRLGGPLAVALVAAAATAAQAGVIGSFDFHVFENNDGVSEAEITHLRLDLFQVDSDSGRFDLFNTNAGGGSKVLDVFFEEDLAALLDNLAFSGANSSAAVNFTEDSRTLPGANNLVPAWNYGTEFKKDGGGNEIHAGEHGSWTFDLAGGATFQDILDGIPHDGSNIGRFAVHVGGLSDQNNRSSSVSAVTIVRGNSVPLPPAAWMGAGLLGLLAVARRRRARRDS